MQTYDMHSAARKLAALALAALPWLALAQPAPAVPVPVQPPARVDTVRQPVANDPAANQLPRDPAAAKAAALAGQAQPMNALAGFGADYRIGPNDLLDNSRSDSFFGRIEGNGRDWIELVVVDDHLDHVLGLELGDVG